MLCQYIWYIILSVSAVILVIVLGISPISRFGPPSHEGDTKGEKQDETSSEEMPEQEERG